MNCQWEPWGAWSDCSSSCGKGERHAIREIKHEGENGGSSCRGFTEKHESCNNGPCPGMRHQKSIVVLNSSLSKFVFEYEMQDIYY